MLCLYDCVVGPHDLLLRDIWFPLSHLKYFSDQQYSYVTKSGTCIDQIPKDQVPYSDITRYYSDPYNLEVAGILCKGGVVFHWCCTTNAQWYLNLECQLSQQLMLLLLVRGCRHHWESVDSEKDLPHKMVESCWFPFEVQHTARLWFWESIDLAQEHCSALLRHLS